MLITPEQVTKAMSLSLQEVSTVATESGYDGFDVIISATFAGMTNESQFVYTITFRDPDVEDDVVVAQLYIYYAQLPGTTRFVLRAEY